MVPGGDRGWRIGASLIAPPHTSPLFFSKVPAPITVYEYRITEYRITEYRISSSADGRPEVGGAGGPVHGPYRVKSMPWIAGNVTTHHREGPERLCRHGLCVPSASVGPAWRGSLHLGGDGR